MPGAFEQHLFGALAPAQLDHHRLAANGIGAAVQHIRNRESTRQGAINIDVGRVDDISDIHHGRIGNGAFIHATFHSSMRMAINNARD
jgi:hypothetical protein